MKTRDWKILATTMLLALAMCGLTQSAVAATPSYLNEMPSVARVLSEVHGTNALDTAARQWGVFWKLSLMIQTLEGPRQFFPDKQTHDEIQLFQSYRSAGMKIETSVQQQLRNQKTSATGMNTPWAKWYNAANGYSFDTAYVLNKFFSPQWQSEYRAAAQRESQTAEAGEKELDSNYASGRTASSGGAIPHFVVVILIILLIPVAVFLSHTRINFNATRFTAGLRHWKLTNITGRVTGYRSHTETSGGGGYTSGNTTTPVQIKTDLFENLRLKLSDGRLWDAELGNFSFSPQVGDVITICVGSRWGSERFVAVLNHTTGSHTVNSKEIFAMGTGGTLLQTLKALAMLTFAVCFAVAGHFVIGFSPFGIWLLRTFFIGRFSKNGIQPIWDTTEDDAQALMSSSTTP